MKFAGKWKELENIILSEVTQTQKDKHGKETEKAKERYDKATMKLHMLHNQYVLALKGAQLHQSQYYDTTLPLLLDSVQKMQEEMIKALTIAAKEQEIKFDTSLLEENENLQANEIMWNNLTADSLQVIAKSQIESSL
ncbi:hypothetical protein STEG23_017471 [Scotinomys teguina]